MPRKKSYEKELARKKAKEERDLAKEQMSSMDQHGYVMWHHRQNIEASGNLLLLLMQHHNPDGSDRC